VIAVDGKDAPAPLLAQAKALVARDELLIYPTDTLYALGGSARSAEAARRVRQAKGRDDGKPLPVIAADLASARVLARAWTPAMQRLADAFWPGPLTLVVSAADSLPEALTAGTGTVAVRVPNLPLTRALCAAAGPLISTSANRQGRAAPVTCAEAVAEVGAAAVLAIDAGPGSSRPSTMVELTGPAPRLIRPGAVPWEDVLRASGLIH
jgi:L-threonylcarbamoyladenylate synthase